MSNVPSRNLVVRFLWRNLGRDRFREATCLSVGRKKVRVMEAEVGRVDAQDLRDFVQRCMEAVGCSTEQATIIADILVEADLRGVHR